MMATLTALWSRVKVSFLIAAAIGTAILAVLRQARRDGINEVLAEQKEKRDELQRHYDKIDSQPPDFDAAIGRLRSRSRDRSGR